MRSLAHVKEEARGIRRELPTFLRVPDRPAVKLDVPALPPLEVSISADTLARYIVGSFISGGIVGVVLMVLLLSL